MLTVALLGAGCAGFSTEEPSGAGPTVLDVSPPDGARGVAAGTPIVLTFNEPVSESSARAAVTLSGIPNDELDFSLDASGTELTVAPRNGFAYASGTDAASAPMNSYAVTVSTALTDREGTPLAEPFTSTFGTLRRVHQTVPNTLSGEYYTYALAVGGAVDICSDRSASFRVGHTSSIAASGDHHGVAAFENALPEGVAEVEMAVLSGEQATPSGSFYGDGVVELEQIPFQTFDTTIDDAPVLTDFGAFTRDAGVERPQQVVLSALADGAAAGERSFMFRLSALDGPQNTFANFYCDRFTLSVTYLVP